MFNLYLESGYLDARAILHLGITFNFIIGARGVGKTFGFLDVAQADGIPFMLMRRQQSQTDIINRPDFSPFKAICEKRHINITTESAGKYSARFIKDDQVIGYTCALSTISNMRGFDASDVKLLLYDEFVPEVHDRPIKEEGKAFLNAIETIGRNRELDNEKPLQVVCMANAFNIANPIFLELGLVGIAERMKLKGQEIYINRERSLSIIMPKSDKIIGRKKHTALYKLTDQSSFSDMALKNDFIYNPSDNVEPQVIKEFKPMVTVGEITIYKHKSQRTYYVSEHRSGNPPTYKTDEIELKRYLKQYGYILNRAYINNNVKFENILTKSLFELYTI